MIAPSPSVPATAALPRLTLVLGGAKSGKSTYAERLIEDAIGPRGAGLYVATAAAGDAEMADRIRQHRARRGAHWRTLEEGLALAEALDRESDEARPILVDCLTLWLSNLLGAGHDLVLARRRLTQALKQLKGPVVLVSNEVGQGIVPDNALARAFRDHAGALHQDIAAIADRVVLVVAGLPLILKDSGAATVRP